MAPGNNGRHPSHTGTIPKTKARNNCNVPQEAVTPTRRDMTTNLVSTSLDWVPVSEYNTRSNYNQSRKPTNNTTNNSDHELTDIDNSAAFEGGFGRFVPVRPQPRALPLNAQNRDNISDHQDDGAASSMTGHTLHPYAHQMQNGLIPHSNHAAAAVMIVNPTTPNATGNISQSFNAPNQNRNNLTRNLNPTRNSFEGSASNNNTPATNSRTVTKTVNLMNNMYEQGQGSFNNLNENNLVHRESARALGEAMVAACPDAASVERRLGQIREYIRVTSSLVDTMRNSEDEAFIEHTKEEYDDLVKMVMQLKDSETSLEQILVERKPDNIEVPADENETPEQASVEITEVHDSPSNNNDLSLMNNNLKKVTNIENEQINKQHNEHKQQDDVVTDPETEMGQTLETNANATAESTKQETKKDDAQLNQILRKNILSCVEKVAQIEQLKRAKDALNSNEQLDVTRPVSVQSNGSAYSENELWQNEIKNKMEMSQMRLTALKQQQKRLIKYQEEAKQQLDEMNRERQSQEIQPSTSHDNFTEMQNHQSHSSNYSIPNRMYAANQIGVATTLPQSTEALHSQQGLDAEHGHSSRHSQEGRFSRDENIASGEEAAGGVHSEGEDDAELAARGQLLHVKLRELQLKKQHMESLVSEFQKLQMVTRVGSTRNTYSSSNEESADEEPVHKCNKAVGSGNIKNEDPFKLMEIKAIKTALQKTKDLMRSVENYEADQLSGGQEDAFREISSTHSNVHDNKSDGGGSMGGWSNDGSMCRVNNSLPARHKFTNEQHSLQHAHQNSQHHMQHLQQHPQQMQQHPQQLQQHPQQLQQIPQQMQQLPQQMQQHPQQLQQLPQQMQQHPQQLQQQNHEANIASLQEMAQELRMETEKIMGERARMKDMISNKEVSRKQKKVNEEVRPGGSGVPGPAERRQMQLRAILAEKQRELEGLLNKEKILCSARDQETQKINPESQATSVINQSYNSEQEEPDSRSEQLLMESQNSREIENFRASGDTSLGGRPLPALPPHLVESNYGSDSDSASRNKSNQRNRPRRRQTQDRQSDDSSVAQSNNASQNMRHEPRTEASNVNTVPPVVQNTESPSNMPYLHLPPPPCWNNKSNQDMRTNQFTQNSHSQTMERLLGTPQMSYPPTMPFNMMMPFGMGGCGCGCSLWGAWCWHQLLMQQREIEQLRNTLNHLEERWRVETASHTLNNQVPPGNRANNYWDNFRSYSRQNLLSANNKANADGHLGPGPAHNPQPLVERSHNPLRRAPSAASPGATPKRNTDAASSSQHALSHNEDGPNRRRNLYERSQSFSSAPDVLNVNQNSENDASTPSHSRNVDDPANVPNVNLNRQEPNSNSFRNLNITNSIPEIIQAHSNNLNSTNSKKKSSSKLPAKNSSRRNFSLEYSQTSNINIASTSDTPNPNLASTSREVQDKATSKLFDLLKENVYSEVTALIGVNESHPDFLIQLFRELQLISSDALRQKVLQSIRSILSQYSLLLEGQSQESLEERPEAVSTTSGESNHYSGCNSLSNNANANMQLDHKIIRFLLLKSDEFCTPELLDALASQVLSGSSSDGRYTQQSKRRLLDLLAKYEGMRVCQIMGDFIENLPMFVSCNGEEASNELPESSMLQDVAGSLNLFRSSDAGACPYELWPRIEADLNDNSARSSQDGKVDLINCTEMHNGDLAEADQTCPADLDDEGTDEAGAADALPDVVDTDEVTPTEAEAEWLGLDRVPIRLHMEETSEKQKD